MGPGDRQPQAWGVKARLGGVVAIAAALGGLGQQQLFSEPSYEFALAAGLLCPSVAAVVTALDLACGARKPLTMFARGVENGVLFALIGYLVAFAYGVYGGFCDLYQGTLLFALGPGIGTVLGGVWGVAVSEVARRRKRWRTWAVLLALAGPWGSVAFHLGWFYATPTIFAFEPFVGYFSGALWDTTLAEGGLLKYRAASAATLFALYVLALHLERGDEQRLRFRWLGRLGFFLLGVLATAGTMASVAWGSHLGHWQTAGTIARELGGQSVGGRCRVIYDARLERDHIARFTSDCDAQVADLEAWLATPDAAKIATVDVFLFFDAGQKRDLMGAGRTSVAKPWRREIYLQNSEYPHPVMRHELMHVLAGAHGRGPFRIAGAVGGWLPNPGLIEGIAEASSPRDDNLSGDEWAAAMRKLELLPPLGELLSLTFFTNHAATSYVAAGSFIDFVRARHGAEALTRWYGGASLAEAANVELSALEREWWAMLDAIPLDAATLKHAEARFDRPGLFERMCPHVVDERLGWANGRVGSGDVDGALDAYERVLALDPGNWTARLGVADCHARRGDRERAEADLAALASDERLTVAVRARAAEEMGDNALRDGDWEKARRLFSEARQATTDENRLRTLDVKDHYADDPVARDALVALLVGSTPTGPYHEEALDRIGRWREERPQDGVPDYLFARQHLDHARFDLAATSLDAAFDKAIGVPRVSLEMARMRTIVACATGEDPTPFISAYRDHPLARKSRIAWYVGMVERCTMNVEP